jgi:RecA-family ATPase
MPLIGELLQEPDEHIAWLCNPFVVRHGITFLYGKTTIGKSPLTWELARCVSQGLPFLGWPTTKSRVLYLEADTPKVVLKPRLQLLPQPIGDWRIEFLVGQNLDLCSPTNKIHAFLKHGRALWGEPDLVIWNVLRQFYRGSSTTGEVVPIVYSAMRTLFPQAGHVVVGHDRKRSINPDAVSHEDEDFSGSSAWWDLATVGLHLIKRQTLQLVHTKSQASEQVPTISLDLDPNGTVVSSHKGSLCMRLAELWPLAPEKGDKAQWVADKMGISRATVYRLKTGGVSPL